MDWVKKGAKKIGLWSKRGWLIYGVVLSILGGYGYWISWKEKGPIVVSPEEFEFAKFTPEFEERIAFTNKSNKSLYNVKLSLWLKNAPEGLKCSLTDFDEFTGPSHYKSHKEIMSNMVVSLSVKPYKGGLKLYTEIKRVGPNETKYLRFKTYDTPMSWKGPLKGEFEIIEYSENPVQKVSQAMTSFEAAIYWSKMSYDPYLDGRDIKFDLTRFISSPSSSELNSINEAQRFLANADTEGAIKSLLDLGEVLENSKILMRFLALIHYSSEDFREGFRWAKKVAESSSASFEDAVFAVGLASKLGRFEDVIYFAEKSYALFKREGDLVSEIEKNYVKFIHYLALLKLDKKEDANLNLESFFGDPKGPYLAQFCMAAKAANEGLSNEAYYHFSGVAQKSPDRFWALHAVCLFSMGFDIPSDKARWSSLRLKVLARRKRNLGY